MCENGLAKFFHAFPVSSRTYSEFLDGHGAAMQGQRIGVLPLGLQAGSQLPVAICGDGMLLPEPFQRAGQVAPEQLELFDEMTTFPLGDNDDLLDAVATGTLFLLPEREPRAW